MSHDYLIRHLLELLVLRENGLLRPVFSDMHPYHLLQHHFHLHVTKTSSYLAA